MVSSSNYPPPNTRRLRIYSFDPALAARYDLAGVSNVTIEIPWEDDLKPGPVGEYIEVVDIDPGSGAAYPPIDLNAPELLATDGLAPSESDPRFHQQMCYAVARKTIEHFERALGRRALWSTYAHTTADGKYNKNFVPRLRIYPHALRQQNAFYSPIKKALLFGYFQAQSKDAQNAPGTTVFSCLSHDIIAHETTHALLDGVHPRFNEPVNEDVLAFHEAFADIVALFQHFSYPGVLRDQIARARGDLAQQSTLGQLAQQFALASGRGAALRSYLGEEKGGKWEPARADPTLLERTPEPHDRGAILVAAVFGAFAKVYKAKTRDLFRIATDGTGVLRDGDIHPDLVNRLADEAQRCSERALQTCIRAIDYCPPVGITFGAYLRAIVTSDYNMNPVDQDNWRLAFIESFREWGIAPRGARSTTEGSPLWPTLRDSFEEQVRAEAAPSEAGRKGATPVTSRSEPSKETADAGRRDTAEQLRRFNSRLVSELYLGNGASQMPSTPLRVSMRRSDLWRQNKPRIEKFHRWLLDKDWRVYARAMGLVVDVGDLPKTISARVGQPDIANVEIHSVRIAMKKGALGFPEPHLVLVVTQWRAGYFDKGKQHEMDQLPGAWSDGKRDFKYRAGCTLLLDLEETADGRIIRTPGTVDDEEELDVMRTYLLQGLAPPDAFHSASRRFGRQVEPFAFLHAHGDE